MTIVITAPGVKFVPTTASHWPMTVKYLTARYARCVSANTITTSAIAAARSEGFPGVTRLWASPTELDVAMLTQLMGVELSFATDANPDLPGLLGGDKLVLTRNRPFHCRWAVKHMIARI